MALEPMYKGGVRVYRLVILGEGSVGKSALTVQFVTKSFVEYYDPTIEDCHETQRVIDDDPGHLQILDTAGQENYTAMREQYMRGGEGFLIVYDITNRRSFEAVSHLHELTLRVRCADNVPVVLIGNKVDLGDQRMVTTGEGQQLARKWECPFVETSALLPLNVEESFAAMVREIRNHEKRLAKEQQGKKKGLLRKLFKRKARTRPRFSILRALFTSS